MAEDAKISSEHDEGSSQEVNEARETMGSVPDLLAHALILPDPGVVEEPTPTSVVDEWAFSDGEHQLEDDDELHERISSMPALSEDVEAPSMTTLRPSAVTLRPKQIQRGRREPLLLAAAAVLVIGAGAWLTAGDDGGAPASAASEPRTEARAPSGNDDVEPAKAATKQGLRLRTSADEVMASVAGESWGPLPVSLSHLSPGTHRIRFEAPGYHTLEREVVVREGEMIDLDVALEPKPVQVVLEVEPASAFVLVSETGNLGDGDERRFPGPWPRILELEPGTYTFVAFRAGFGNVQREVVVEPGPKASAVRFELAQEDLYE